MPAAVIWFNSVWQLAVISAGNVLCRRTEGRSERRAQVCSRVDEKACIVDS